MFNIFFKKSGKPFMCVLSPCIENATNKVNDVNEVKN